MPWSDSVVVDVSKPLSGARVLYKNRFNFQWLPCLVRVALSFCPSHSCLPLRSFTLPHSTLLCASASRCFIAAGWLSLMVMPSSHTEKATEATQYFPSLSLLHFFIIASTATSSIIQRCYCRFCAPFQRCRLSRNHCRV